MAISTPSPTPTSSNRAGPAGAFHLSAWTELKFLRNRVQIGPNSGSKCGRARSVSCALERPCVGLGDPQQCYEEAGNLCDFSFRDDDTGRWEHR